MLSYVSRRRRWWKFLKALDSSIELSEPMRVELLLELSGLSRQESLVIKACTSDSRSFQAVGATLVEHYSGVHLREGRSLGGGTFPDRRHASHGARTKSNPKGYGKGKARGFTRRAYFAEDETHPTYDDACPQEDEDAETTTTLRTPPLGTKLPSTTHTYPAGEEDEEPSYEDFELDEDEATALNCLEDLDPEEPESGHVIQLQLAANAAFGKAKGRKGKGRGKGKSKGKDPVIDMSPTTQALLNSPRRMSRTNHDGEENKPLSSKWEPRRFVDGQAVPRSPRSRCEEQRETSTTGAVTPPARKRAPRATSGPFACQAKHRKVQAKAVAALHKEAEAAQVAGADDEPAEIVWPEEGLFQSLRSALSLEWPGAGTFQVPTNTRLMLACMCEIMGSSPAGLAMDFGQFHPFEKEVLLMARDALTQLVADLSARASAAAELAAARIEDSISREALEQDLRRAESNADEMLAEATRVSELHAQQKEPTVTLLVSLGSTQERWGGLPGLRPALRPGLRPAMAVRDAQKTSEEERCVTFSLGDELFRYQANGESPCTFGLPWAPPSEKIFDLHFFWQLWSNLAKAAMRKDVPLVSLRNMSYMLNDTYKIPRALDVNFFGQLSKKYCSWPDLRHSLITEGHPSIKLSFLERVFLMLEEPNSCILAKVWFYVIMFAAVANLTSFILPETATWIFEQIWGHSHHEKHKAIFSTVCILIFTADYVSKLVCSPFVRVELVQPSEKYFHLDESQRAVVPQTGTQRCLDFMLQVTNIVDLLAILPWWLDLCFVNILPGAAFLRIIRISRIFHLFKSARYFDMVQVLGLTLWKSINLVGIVFALITVVGLFAACLLQQTEVTMGSQMSEVFETVPASWFWIFCRLIGMKDTIYGKGKVQSYFGIAILAVTLTLKGVLWIVPIARIRQIFSQEYAIVVNTSKARKKMIDDLLAFVAGSDQSLVQSRNGYICCNLQLYSITKEEAWVPLPLHQNEEVKLEKYRVALSSSASAAEVFLDILWKPGAAMKNSANSLPQGTLALTLVGGWRLPDGLHEIQWEVPVDTFSTEKQTVTLKAATKTTDTVTFEIAWTGSGEDDEPREIDDDLQMDYRDFQKQVLHLLQEQAELIQEQQHCEGGPLAAGLVHSHVQRQPVTEAVSTGVSQNITRLHPRRGKYQALWCGLLNDFRILSDIARSPSRKQLEPGSAQSLSSKKIARRRCSRKEECSSLPPFLLLGGRLTELSQKRREEREFVGEVRSCQKLEASADASRQALEKALAIFKDVESSGPPRKGARQLLQEVELQMEAVRLSESLFASSARAVLPALRTMPAERSRAHEAALAAAEGIFRDAVKDAVEPLQPSLPMKPGQQWTVGKDMEPPTADATSLTGDVWVLLLQLHREILYRRRKFASVKGPGDVQPRAECCEWIRAAVRHPAFDLFFALVVVSNSIFIGVEVEQGLNSLGPQSMTIFVFQYAYSGLFTVELVLRLAADGCQFLCGPDWVWSWLDVFIVLSSLWEIIIEVIYVWYGDANAQEAAEHVSGIINLKAFRVIRITRIVKAVKLMRIFRFVIALRTLITSIIHTLQSLFWALALLVLIVYVFAVLFVGAVNDFKLDPDNPKLPTREMEASDLYFSSLPDTMLSLFMCIAGGVNWGEVQSPLKAISTVWVFFFLFYVAFTYFAVLNVVTGAILARGRAEIGMC
eukprot:s860_g20.t2